MSRLEGEQIPFRTAADRKKLIGKRIRYLRSSDIDRSGRGYFFPRSGMVADTHRSQIILEGGNSIHASELVELVLIESQAE